MVAHPRKAVPGAMAAYRARRGTLLRDRAGEVYRFAAAGWPMRDMATRLGVSLRALYYGQRRCSEIAEALARGRAEYARRCAAEAAATVAMERRARHQAAQEVKALLDTTPAPAALPSLLPAPSPPLRSPLPQDALQDRAAGGRRVPPCQPQPQGPSAGDCEPVAFAHPLDDYSGKGAPVPLDDPF